MFFLIFVEHHSWNETSDIATALRMVKANQYATSDTSTAWWDRSTLTYFIL